jgi:hypothetical protein
LARSWLRDEERAVRSIISYASPVGRNSSTGTEKHALCYQRSRVRALILYRLPGRCRCRSHMYGLCAAKFQLNNTRKEH